MSQPFNQTFYRYADYKRKGKCVDCGEIFIKKVPNQKRCDKHKKKL